MTVEFDASTYNEVVGSIKKLTNQILDAIWPIMPPAMDVFLGNLFFGLPVPGFVRDACQKALRWCFEAFRWFVDTNLDALEGVLVPVVAALRAVAWNTEHNRLLALTRDAEDAVADVSITWKGPGAEAFKAHAAQHTARLHALDDLTVELRNQTGIIAGAGLALYLAIAKICIDASAATAASAASTAVDGPVGPVAAGASAGLGAGGVLALITGFSSLIGPTISGLTGINDKAQEVRRAWPEPGTVDYADGSASDGNGSGWSTER